MIVMARLRTIYPPGWGDFTRSGRGRLARRMQALKLRPRWDSGDRRGVTFHAFLCWLVSVMAIDVLAQAFMQETGWEEFLLVIRSLHVWKEK